MESRYDPDTLKKIELINAKVDEINQRRMSLPTTRVDDELDRQELYEYVKTLNLNDEQKKLVDRYCCCNHMERRGEWIRFAIMITSVALQVFIALEISRLFWKSETTVIETLYMVALAIFFVFNAFQILRYLRILR